MIAPFNSQVPPATITDQDPFSDQETYADFSVIGRPIDFFYEMADYGYPIEYIKNTKVFGHFTWTDDILNSIEERCDRRKKHSDEGDIIVKPHILGMIEAWQLYLDIKTMGATIISNNRGKFITYESDLSDWRKWKPIDEVEINTLLSKINKYILRTPTLVQKKPGEYKLQWNRITYTPSKFYGLIKELSTRHELSVAEIEFPRIIKKYKYKEGDPDYIKEVSDKLWDYDRPPLSFVFRQIVKRILEPGCGVSGFTTIVGSQGHYKTEAVKWMVLDPQFFKESFDIMDTEDQIITHTAGKHLVCLDEYRYRSGQSLEKLKMNITRSVDEGRLKYDRTSTRVPRGFAMVATTNVVDFIPDDKEHRRFYVSNVKLKDEWFEKYPDETV